MIISEMQRKPDTWAATDPSRRTERLRRLMTRPEWLAEAARLILSSKGAHTPGVDGVNKAKPQAGLPAELQRPRENLLPGHYQLLPARRVYIPKTTANCDHWGSRVAGSYCSAVHADGDGACPGE
ncbi:TPA: reverse transcriptase [Salmonella enterica]|uniref:Reverse transcriptase n=1 Tax=Salmonella enterica TaxID=28901 RepID=A0A763SYB9_SALER|nr:reverse transcriptase [Salmonella enterica]HAK2580993.1 reverse transcriptase [Salmonella enterica]